MKHYPLSRGQERLWFEDRLEPGMTTYNIPYCYRLEGPLDIDALRKSVETVVGRHEVLRSVVRKMDDTLVQEVHDYSPGTFSFTECGSLSEEERSVYAMQIAAQEARTPFDLCRGPLVRVKVQRLTASEHLLSLTFHHIITDGWSVTVSLKELSACYQAYAAGREPTFAAAPVQFGEYACRERESKQEASIARNGTYWQAHLEGTLSSLDLPTDRSRPPVRRSAGARVLASIDPALLGKLRPVSSRNGVTPFMLLLAAFKTLLYRYTGQEDILVGTPVAGRNTLELFEAIGFFVNTIVLRTSLEGNPRFPELLKRVRETTLGALDHQDFPFEELVRMLQIRRDPSRTPVYQVMFVQDPTGEPFDLSGVSVEKIDVHYGGTKCDLTLFIRECAEGAQIEFEYSTDLFDEATIRRMAGHYARLLEGIAENPECRIGQLPLLGETEQRQLLGEWCATAREYPRDSSIQAIFENEVALNGERTALISGSAHVTYNDLNHRANRLAHRLRREGVGPETPVGLCLERSIDMVVGILGILKAGGAYVPLDPESPDERLRYMLEDGQIRVVVTNARWCQRFGSDSIRSVCLDADGLTLAVESGENLNITISAESLAYIMYTSGSTGKPKGVCVNHRGVTRLVKGNPYASFGSNEVFLQLAPFAFDASTFEIWGSLLNGACLVIPPPAPPTFDELGKVIREGHVTTLWLTAGLFHSIVDTNLESLDGLRQLLVGGDVVSPSHTARFKSRYPGCRLINGYGPTENTTFTCCYEITGSEVGSLPIGRPIANTVVYILDRELQPVPTGVIGELCIAGDGLARGYLNDDKLTAEKFVPNPFRNPAAPKLYRSGDRARYRSDGVILFEGREDNQVKVSGYRIELGEIEAVLRSYPGLAQVFVQARPSPDGEKTLVAYCVPAAGKSFTGSTLRKFLKEKLPKHLIPASFVVLAKLPLNPQGKVDRLALPEPQPADSSEERTPTAPRDALEAALASIWKKLFAVEAVGIHDNFFELGGHSLMALRFFAELEKSAGVYLPLATLFQAPTIEQLAAVIRDKGQPLPGPCLIPIKAGGMRPPIYLMAGVGGHVLEYQALTKHLSPEQPVYGIQSLGLDGEQKPLTRVDDMARCYIEEIRRFQPSGPYYLAGYCLGGTVAYQMAKQLTADGEKVALVALIDSPIPLYSPYRIVRVWDRFANFGRRIQYHASNLVRLPPAKKLDYVQQARQKLAQRIHNSFSLIAFGRKRSESALLEKRVQDIEKNNLRAVQLYWALPEESLIYDGKVTIFLATEKGVRSPSDSIEEWRAYVRGGVEVVDVPGNHGTILREPNVRVLAQRLDERISSFATDEHKQVFAVHSQT